MNYTFANPAFFYLFSLIPLMIAWYWFKHNQQHAVMNVSTLSPFQNYKPTLKLRLRHSLFVCRIVALSLLIIALARPRTTSSGSNSFTEGVDIVLCMDVSQSMLAEDFKPNRIEAAKKVAIEFINQRPNDRIGLVVFAGESFTQCPVTSDHDVLKNLFSSIQDKNFMDGTAIGEGLATAVSRIKDSKAKSKIVILLTDGVNNSGQLAPLTATEIAKAFGITVYTIGVGTKGLAPYPVQTPFGIQYQNMEVQIDEEVLTSIAKQTGGEYFRATNNSKLKEVYAKIDKLEKTRIETTTFKTYTEKFLIFALLAALLLLVEILLKYTVFKTLP